MESEVSLVTHKNDESGATLVQDIGSACPGKGVALKTAKDSIAATTSVRCSLAALRVRKTPRALKTCRTAAFSEQALDVNVIFIQRAHTHRALHGSDVACCRYVLLLHLPAQ